MVGELERCGWGNPVEREARTPLGEFTQMFPASPGLVCERQPIEIFRVHEYGTKVALTGILKRTPVHAFPYGFVGILVNFSAIRFEPRVHALGESAVLGELCACALMLLCGNVTAAARSSELKDQCLAAGRARLRAIVCAFRKVGDRTRLHRPVRGEVEVACKLISHLVEIMPVPG